MSGPLVLFPLLIQLLLEHVWIEFYFIYFFLKMDVLNALHPTCTHCLMQHRLMLGMLLGKYAPFAYDNKRSLDVPISNDRAFTSLSGSRFC